MVNAKHVLSNLLLFFFYVLSMYCVLAGLGMIGE